MSKKRNYWFPVKSYGWGWGMPACWQGWSVLAGYVALVIVGVGFFHARDAAGPAIFLAALTAVFISIVIAKGERPVRWRWGRK